MIEPLRLSSEAHPPLQINKVLFCEACLVVKARKHNPNVAIKICDECVRQYLCLECDEIAHRAHDCRHHQRRTLVIGAGIRKRIIRRGDAVSFPYSLDEVKVKLKSRVFHKGLVIHKEPSTYAKFRVGLSGISVHVQILGARKLLVSDINNTSDPFVTAVYSGTKLGSTRVRPRDLNPQWDNETFVVPMDDNFPDPKNMQRSQKHLFKLEVYDYDWFSFNDFLGHVEIPRKKLYKMAIASKEKPVCLPLSIREFHGIVGLTLGFDNKELYIKINRAESLDKVHPFGLDNPYAKIFFGDKLLGSTPVIWGTLDPEWIHSNVFRVKINDVLAREHDILLFIKEKAASLMSQAVPVAGENGIQYAGSSVINSSTTSSHATPIAAASQSLVPSTSQTIKSLPTGSGTGSGGSQAVSLDPHQERQQKQQQIQLPQVKVKEMHEMVSINMLEDSQLFLRIELYDYNTYLSHTHLGTARVGIQFLRKMLPNFPKTAIEEKVGLVSQLTRRLGIESNRGVNMRSTRLQKSMKEKSAKGVGQSARSLEDSTSIRSTGNNDDSRALSGRIKLPLFSGRISSLRLNSNEPSARIINSSRISSQRIQSGSVSERNNEYSSKDTSRSKPNESARSNDENKPETVTPDGDGDGTIPAASVKFKEESQALARINSEGPSMRRQISQAIFGRLLSNKNVEENNSEEDVDHEDLLQEVYGDQLADNNEDEDAVLNEIGKRIVDAHGLTIHQNYEPTERKRVGGKVLKVAAYQDLMAKKALKEKQQRPVHLSKLGNVSTSNEQMSSSLLAGSGDNQNAVVDSGSGGAAGEGGLAIVSPERSKAVTFEDSIELQGNLRIGEIGFENEDSMMEGDHNLSQESAQDYNVMNDEEYQPSTNLLLEGNDWQDDFVQESNYSQAIEGEYVADVANIDQGLNEEMPMLDTDMNHGASVEDVSVYQDGEIDPHVNSAESSVASLRSHITANSHPSYQSNFSQPKKHTKQDRQSYASDGSTPTKKRIHSQTSSPLPGSLDDDSQSIVEADMVLENYDEAAVGQAQPIEPPPDAHADTVFDPEGLVPLGFDEDQREIDEFYEEEVQSEESSGSLSADDMQREESIDVHKKANLLHIDHDAMYVDEEGDEFRPLIDVKNAKPKLRPRNTILNMFRRLSISGVKESDNDNDTENDQAVANAQQEGDLGYVKNLVRRSTRFMSMRVNMMMGGSRKGAEEEAVVDDEEAERQARIKALGENPVVWSSMRHFHIEQLTPKNVAQPNEKNRGFLVVRLIPSTRGEVIIGLDEAVRHMSLGETASVKCRYDYAYGNYCLGGSIPPRANLVFTMELQEINGVGRYGAVNRQLIRCYRFTRRWYRKAKRRYDAVAFYMRINKPILHCLAPVFLRVCGWDLFPEPEEEEEEIQEDVEQQEDAAEESDGDEEDISDSDDSESEAGQRVKIDKHMKKHIDGGVVAGANFMWNYDPKARKRLKARLKEQAKQRKLEQLQQQRRRENAILTRIAEAKHGDEDEESQAEMKPAEYSESAGTRSRRQSMSTRSKRSNSDASQSDVSRSDRDELASNSGSETSEASKPVKPKRKSTRRSSNASSRSGRQDEGSVGSASPSQRSASKSLRASSFKSMQS